MSHSAHPPVGRTRLNPFAFPSDTILRFGLLLIFAVMGLFNFFLSVWVALNDTEAVPDRCMMSAVTELYSHPPPLDNIEANGITILNKIALDLAGCVASLRARTAFSMTGIALTIGFALLIYCTLPHVKIRTQKLQAITAHEPPGLLDELYHLCGEVGLHRPPLFLWNPLSPDLPIAFGGPRRRYVAFGGGFLTSYYYRDRPAFRAILLHELAHIVNRDISKTYIVVSVWIAGFAANVLGLALLAVDGLHASVIIQLFVEVVIYNFIILLSGLAVLRTREYYADVKASAWDKTVSGIDNALRLLPSFAGGIQSFRFHPTATLRRQTVADPSRLFHPSVWDAFGIGIAVRYTILFVQMIALIFAPKPGWMLIAYMTFLPILVTLLLFLFGIGALGISIWRAAFSALMRGDNPYNGTGRLALTFSCGYLFEIGLEALSNFASAYTPHQAQILVNADLISHIGIGFLALLPTFLIFRWIAANVSAWLEIALRHRSPRGLALTTVAAAIVLVSVAFGEATYVALRLFFGTAQAAPLANLDVFGAIMFLAVTLAWSFPLSAWFWQSAPSEFVSGWVALGEASNRIPDRQPLVLGRAVLTGVIAGLGLCLLLEIAYFRAHLPFAIGFWVNSAFSSALRWATVAFSDSADRLSIAVMIAQAIAAIVAAAQAKRSSVFCGLFSSFLAGIVIAIWDGVFYGVAPGFANLMVVTLSRLGMGTMVALPVAFVAAWMGSLVRRRARRGAPNSRRSRIAIGATTALAVVVLIGAGVRIVQAELALKEVAAHRTLAEKGDAKAQNWLGVIYATGNSVPSDDAQALEWFRRAAEQGNADAEMNVARMYLLGRGVPRDMGAILSWLSKAAEHGQLDAQNTLGEMYFQGMGVAQDDTQAAKWFLRAANQGDPEGQYNLALMYELGRSLPQDDVKSVAWMRKAAEQGHVLARQHLQAMCAKGFDQGCFDRSPSR